VCARACVCVWGGGGRGEGERAHGVRTNHLVLHMQGRASPKKTCAGSKTVKSTRDDADLLKKQCPELLIFCEESGIRQLSHAIAATLPDR
jgi:hypothetical protein